MKDTIYINGTLHLCEWESDTRMFADTAGFPGVRCSQHTFKPGSRAHLQHGGAVIGGNHYSMRKPTVFDSLTQPTIPVESSVDDMYDNITQWIAYGIGALMAFVMFCMMLGYVAAKLG